MRGKPAYTGADREAVRITPADAGKTRISSSRSGASEDHPRGCGENGKSSCESFRFTGSPPRMRGKLSQFADLIGWLRITPADAGKTFLLFGMCRLSSDHPRACGENAGNIKLISIPDGSPPRMRGKQLSAGSPAQPLWITPADAGKTRSQNEQLQHLQDHPRGCGENRESLNYATRDIGSPPRMRGKPLAF